MENQKVGVYVGESDCGILATWGQEARRQGFEIFPGEYFLDKFQRIVARKNNVKIMVRGGRAERCVLRIATIAMSCARVDMVYLDLARILTNEEVGRNMEMFTTRERKLIICESMGYSPEYDLPIARVRFIGD